MPSALVTLPPSLAPHFPEPRSRASDEPLLFALVDGLCEVGVVVHDGGVGALGGLRPLRLVGVVGALVTEHVANEEDQGAEDGEDHHGDDPWGTQDRGPRGYAQPEEPASSPPLFAMAPSGSLSHAGRRAPGQQNPKRRGQGQTGCHSYIWRSQHFSPRSWQNDETENQSAFSSLQLSRSVVSDSLRPYEPQPARPPCPSPTPGVYSNSCPSSWDAIQPSHPLSSPSPPAPNPSQHQGLFQ